MIHYCCSLKSTNGMWNTVVHRDSNKVCLMLCIIALSFWCKFWSVVASCLSKDTANVSIYTFLCFKHSQVEHAKPYTTENKQSGNLPNRHSLAYCSQRYLQIKLNLNRNLVKLSIPTDAFYIYIQAPMSWNSTLLKLL